MKGTNCRKKAGDAELHWYESAAALPGEWDASLPEAHYLRSATLAAHEAARLRHIRYRYAMAQAGEAVVLQAGFQVLSIHRSHVKEESLKGWQRFAWRAISRLTSPKLLVAGHLFRHDVPNVQYHSITPFEAFQLYRQALHEAARRTGAGAVLVKDPPPDFIPYFRQYEPKFLLLRNDISMQMEVLPEWTAIKDYEKSLKHKYAQRFRKVRQAFDGTEVRSLNIAEVGECAGTLHALYEQVARQQQVRLGILTPEFLPELKAHYGEDLQVWAFYKDDAMVAWASAWCGPANADKRAAPWVGAVVRADTNHGAEGQTVALLSPPASPEPQPFDMFYIGFDYARNAELQLYFNLLFFAVEQAIARRAPQLILGRTALEAKARVGCTASYLHTFLYIRNPWLRRIVAGAQQNVLSMEGEWENRHPFK